MSHENMIYDFEYLITALEENWPFFNLSISANGVDVHVLAENTRAFLNNPANDINEPFDFMDIMQLYFFGPINQLGGLTLTTSYSDFFNLQSSIVHAIEQGANNRTTFYLHELTQKQEVQLFYDRLQNAGRGTQSLQAGQMPIMQFDILEAGQIAYMSVNRMINVWDDSYGRDGMWQHELRAYNFTQNIEGYNHLIIDFRGNTGGSTMHFRSLVLPMFLREFIYLHAYVHYMGGTYATLAREVFDMRYIWPAAFQSEIEDTPPADVVSFESPLPYLDAEINFTHTISTRLFNIPVYHYYGVMASARQEVLFDGKIWLLVDEYTASSAEAIAAMLKYNDIVTVVGTATAGNMSFDFEPAIIKMSLPNTGMVVQFSVAYYTCPLGRPFQGYGIQPHYINRPNMDALETVLVMINEGAY
ncbi:MAG: S41 family peptidase [Defluviitaleaceae bacterium]|nr:S41 family peptidase [Defluviitaleaceae bacterium]